MTRRRNIPKSRGYLFQVASSHPPARTAAAVPPEFFLFVLLLDFYRHHGLREGQSQHVAVIGPDGAVQVPVLHLALHCRDSEYGER